MDGRSESVPCCAKDGTYHQDCAVDPPDAALAAVKAELHAKGYRWHAFGIPRNRSGEAPVGASGQRRYWFNGSQYDDRGRAVLTRQPFGWFTLDEMRAEKFAEGLHFSPSRCGRTDCESEEAFDAELNAAADRIGSPRSTPTSPPPVEGDPK